MYMYMYGLFELGVRLAIIQVHCVLLNLRVNAQVAVGGGGGGGGGGL